LDFFLIEFDYLILSEEKIEMNSKWDFAMVRYQNHIYFVFSL